MSLKTLYFYFTLVFVWFSSCNSQLISSNIPRHLQQCYRSGSVNITAPMNLRLLIEIINKLEKSEPNLSIRMMSYSIIKSFRLDGIERAPNIRESEFVVPYGASAFQFHKYKLLMDTLIPGENVLEVERILSTYEICSLHKMVSSTVDRWERGDEKYVCPLNMESNFVVSSFNTTNVTYSANSRCPIEEGVVLSPWGTIAPGVVIATITAAFESQSVSIFDILMSDDFHELLRHNKALYETGNVEFGKNMHSNGNILNSWAASIAGDLAEVLIRQGPHMGSTINTFKLGPAGKWNDTFLPRKHYLFLDSSSNNWEFTDSEILGGIDGLIISRSVSDWSSVTSKMRLSQVIDMYYSKYGLIEERNVNACNRPENFFKLYNETLVLDQTMNFAKILSLTHSVAYVEPEKMNIFGKQLVGTFTTYFTHLLRSYNSCTDTNFNNNAEVIVVTDGTWDRYGVEVLLLSIIETFDVSEHGSRLGLLQGNTGNWIVKPSHSVAKIYESINNYTMEFSWNGTR